MGGAQEDKKCVQHFGSEVWKEDTVPEVSKLWGVAPPGGGGASCLYEEHIYFERNMGAR
jgi:hypothetical protein